MEANHLPEELTVPEAAAVAGTKEPNIRRAIAAGKIKARAVLVKGARAAYRIDTESLLEWRKSWGVRRTAGERRDTAEEWGRQRAEAPPGKGTGAKASPPTGPNQTPVRAYA